MRDQRTDHDRVPSRSRDGRRAVLLRWACALAVTIVLAFCLQGTRGLWEPDEGFYANVASGMAATGDWWIPRLNGVPFLDKPPLHYWGMAAGVLLFGPSEIGLRTAHALWFIGTAWLVGLLAAGLWGRRAGPLATVAYAVMLAPFLAANTLTPDTVLTFWVTAMTYAYWRSHSSTTRRARFAWTVAAGVCAGFGLLAKGPALLVFALPLALHGVVVEGFASLRRLEVGVAAALALIIGGSWYAVVAQLLPGAAAYLFDNQVAGRLWSDHYHRNAGLLGPIRVYLPTLVAGTLPWAVLWPGSVMRLALSVRRSGWSSLRARPAALLVLLWIAAPLAILSLASSRLPFYVLPVMPAFALAAAARLRHVAHDFRTPAGRPLLLAMAVWVILLVAIKGAAAYWPDARDTRRLARALDRLRVDPATPIVAVDLKCNALPVYGFGQLVQARWRNRPYPFYSPPAPLEEVLRRDVARRGERVFLVKEEKAPFVLVKLYPLLELCQRWGSSDDIAIVGCGRASPAPPLVLSSAAN